MPKADMEILKQAGYKLTKPRQAVWLVLRAAQAPLSAQEVWKKVKNQGVDLVSVYRTLRLLRALDLAQEESAGNEIKYCLGGGQHHHVTCSQCAKTVSIPCTHIIPKIKGFVKISHQFILRGLCQNCAQAN